jgi:hypothetical protein
MMAGQFLIRNTMYDYLLAPGDKLKKFRITELVDLEDYIYMRQAHLAHTVKWKSIRSLIVTEQGDTLWQLSEKYLDSEPARAIGQLEPPVTFIRWITQR